MRKTDLLGATALALLMAAPAVAQDVGNPAPQGAPLSGPAPSATTTSNAALSGNNSAFGDIVVTAQRQAERLQDVPIAVSAFTSEGLKARQINNSTELQLSLPNITFTKTNFTSSSFTIRGIGDLCTGVTCDSATGIHVNDMPLVSTRLFETEFFDLERVEVLRGPQGTLFGRNATSGVVNFITGRPNLSAFGASGSAEYGNYNSIRLEGMVNAPITNTIGVRLAGYYLNRDGFTQNLFNNDKIDGRNLYAFRGTIRWEPSPDTTLDIIGYYFHERDDRSRIQKQLCHRDPTGILGCLPDRLENGTTNGNSTLAAIFTSKEFLGFALGPTFAPFALGSVYGQDFYSNFNSPPGLRQVSIDHEPTYYAQEYHIQGRLEQRLGDRLKATITGGYAKNSVDSTTDYNLAVENSLVGNTGIATLAATAAAPGALFPGGVNPYTQAVQALAPNGAAGPFCQSAPDPNGNVFTGSAICAPRSVDLDRSNLTAQQYSIEAHVDSSFDGMFNFLLGGIYLDSKTRDNSYYVNSFGLDYASAIIGAANVLGARVAGATLPNAYAGTPYYRNFSDYYRLKSYGIFGETYFQLADRLKLTLGLRYNHDEKIVRARTSLIFDTQSCTLRNSTRAAPTAGTANNCNFTDNGAPLLLDAEGRPVTVSAVNTVLNPFGTATPDQAINAGLLDYDPVSAGPQLFATDRVAFGRLTGRAVLDFKISPDNLLYFSYSRGYKSGGINPPLSPSFTVPTTFAPETVNAFEIGSKNTFGDLQLNLTGFYYQYKNLQLSRIVARTSVNDNINANIMGVEAEAIAHPGRNWLINLSASYLKTRVSGDRFLANPQDPSGGRTDAVIIKDITNASNCAVRPVGGAAGTGAAAAFVDFVNTQGLASAGVKPTQQIYANGTRGAYSVCSVLAAVAAGNGAAYNSGFALLQPFANALFNGGKPGPLPFVVDSGGVAVNVRGNRLPQAPEWKFSAGLQYTADLGGDMNLVPRVDLTYTGDYYASIFNQPINRIQGYAVINAQVQLNGPDNRWFVRGFIQNALNNNAITGEYVTDQSSGNFTNIFTLEPRRYGIAAGFKF